MPDTMFMKERMLITGGHALQGTVHISGGKNTAVAVIPATLLCDEPCTIENLPDISDVHALVDILCSLGAKVNYEPNRFMTVDPRPAEGWQVSYRACAQATTCWVRCWGGVVRRKYTSPADAKSGRARLTSTSRVSGCWAQM